MSMYKDEYEKGMRNLNKGKQGLTIQLSVCVCVSKNETSANECTVCTHERALSSTILR